MIKINTIGLFLQVRLNSNRMPGKALLSISGKMLITHVMDRLSVVPADHRVLVTSQESADVLKPIAENSGWSVFVGDSHNVLKRFVDAALYYNVDTIVRATGDNPLTSSEIAIETINLFNKKNADLAYLSPVPFGSGVEVVKRDALVKALANTDVSYDLEHVTPYLYRNTNDFKVVTESYHSDEVSRSDVKLSVDTRQDYERVNFFIKNINSKKINMTLPSIINLWDELSFEKYKYALIVVDACHERGLSNLKRGLLLSEKLSRDYFVFFSLRNEDDDALRMIKSGNVNYMSLDDAENYVFKNSQFDRVILDIGDTDIEEMNFYLTLGPVFSIDDEGDGGQLSYVNVNTSDCVKKSEHIYNFKGNQFNFINIKKNILKKRAGLKNILVSFGGSDQSLLTNRVLRALNDKGYSITVVSGPFFTEKVESYGGVKVVYSPESLDKYIQEADLVVTSYGMTFFESLQSKTPVLLLNRSYSHDDELVKLGYKYFINKNKIDDKISFDKYLNEAVSEMSEDSCFVSVTDYLAKYYSMNTGDRIDDFVNTINQSAPSIVICPNCCNFTADFVERTEKWNMYRCCKCGLYYVDYFYDNKMNYDGDYFFKEYEEQYGKTYEDDRDNIRRIAEERLRVIKKYVKSGKLLDFGSGLGFFAEYASENGFSPFCLDISDYAVSYIKEKLRINAFKADQSYLEKNDDKFDVITAFYVIEHLTDFEKTIFMFANHLNKNGVLALSTPNAVGISVKRKFEQYIKKHPEDHCYIFSPGLLRKLLIKRGFKNIRIRITGIHPSRFTSSDRVLRSKVLTKIIWLYAKIFKLGDTFEIYAQKN